MAAWWLWVACGAGTLVIMPSDDGGSDSAGTEDTPGETAVQPPEEPLDCDGDKDGFERAVPGCSPLSLPDCNDADPVVFPGAEDVCNGVDDDCSGAADEAFDVDGDGQAGCAGDCDDADPGNAGILPERCDGADNDCDGEADEGFDRDGDGIRTCRGDCDDADATVYLGAEERCDGRDNDCDPLTSEAGDLDGDGIARCDGDCDDLDATVAPGQVEVCDLRDNDCDGLFESDPGCFDCATVSGFMVCRQGLIWDDAKRACEAFGTSLATAAGFWVNDRLGQATAPLGYTWIGLSDVAQEGVWVWESGVAYRYTKWAPFEPNNAGGSENCVGTNFNGVGTWNDFTCTTVLPFACDAP
jgi:hypothetical protein